MGRIKKVDKEKTFRQSKNDEILIEDSSSDDAKIEEQEYILSDTENGKIIANLDIEGLCENL